MEKKSEEGKQKELDREASQNEQIRETGQAVLDGNSRKHKVELLTVIGEIEGHESAPSHSKTTKYEHVLPKLALIEDDEEIEGLLILLNTVGGDVEAGLAIAEMIASLSIPTVSLVLGGGHSIGVPMAVSADYSFIVPSATMLVHPVRQNGMFIGVAQSYRNMEKIQDRIIAFVSGHSHITAERMEELMLDTSQLVKDVGTMQEKKIHMGIVVDEYGQTAGIVSMEDIIEEIVGNILDEYDDEEEVVEYAGDDTYVVDGLTAIEDINSLLGIKIESDGFETLNGFLISKLGRIASENETEVIEAYGFSFKILEVTGNVIRKVEITKIDKKEGIDDEQLQN